uniref:BTB domain-containing protein n=1 Tax=Panagrellus redivivus TaxID=6233 RepID=A0A7E4VHV0_PANRE
MSKAVNNSGMNQLAKEISGLHLDEQFADVTIVIDGVEIPAHRMILSQRCPYFKAMFASGMIESKSKRIELRETPINGFKSVLKWIYTGVSEFTDLSTALEILRLASMYQLMELGYLAVDYINSKLNIDNVWMVLNESANITLGFLSLNAFATVRLNSWKFVQNESFVKLHLKVLKKVLERDMGKVENTEILEALVRWMKANPDQSVHFLDLLKMVPLNSIGIGDLASIVPSELMGANVLMEVAREQQAMFETGAVVNTNFVSPKYGVRVLSGGDPNYFSPRSRCRFLTHVMTRSDRGIVVDLGQVFTINEVGLYLSDWHHLQQLAYTYTVDVSKNKSMWARVAYHVCENRYCTNHDHFFKKVNVRYIRIWGQEPVNETFVLCAMEVAYCVFDVYDESEKCPLLHCKEKRSKK